MIGKRSRAASAMAAGLLVSLLAPFVNLYSQDLVATEEIGGGSSVFVFRDSSKKPQVKAAGGSGVLGRAGRGGGRRHIDSAYLASKRKHSTVARSTTTRRPAAATARLKLAETLATKADTQMQSGQTDTAIATYRDAVEKRPKKRACERGPQRRR